jgi:RHS repeat-associated protein
MKFNFLTTKRVLLWVIVFVPLRIFSQTQMPVNNVAAPTASPLPVPNNYFINNNLNFVRTWQPNVPTSSVNWVKNSGRNFTEVVQSTSYVNGLGMPLQEVTKNAISPDLDLVATHIYDVAGHELVTYLPFAATSNGGKFREHAFTEQRSFFQNQFPGELFYYQQNIVEQSPEARMLKQMPQGNSWVGSQRGANFYYEVNAAMEVMNFTVDMYDGKPFYNGFYPAGTLTKVGVKNEDGKTTWEYKNKNGEVVLKKVQLADGSPDSKSHVGWLSTYYLLDVAGRLRFVFSPKATDDIVASNGGIHPTVLSELCYEYIYDDWGRLIFKKIPGTAESLFVYDAKNRLVLMQDAQQRLQNTWLVTKYDAQNRPTSNYTWESNGLNIDQIRSFCENDENFPTVAAANLLTETYYDSYQWLAASGTGWQPTVDLNGVSQQFISSTNVAPYYAQPLQVHPFVVGMPTGTRTRVLGSNAFLYTMQLFDDKGRTLQVKKQNHLQGVDVFTTQYSYNATPLISNHLHKIANQNPISITTLYEYDANWRPVAVKKRLANNAIQTLATYTYNNLGQMIEKKIGLDGNQSPIETQVIDFNIRGWLTGVNKTYVQAMYNVPTSWFGFTLNYNEGFTQPFFSGNISGQVWRTKGSGNKKRAHGYTYDAANRILKADFTEGDVANNFSTNPDVNFNVLMGDGVNATTAYDANGNIRRMQHYGLTANTSEKIDDLVYSYAHQGFSNKLLRVTDAATNTLPLGDFKDGNNPAEDYQYNANGSLTADENKKIQSITYNFLNLPQSVVVTGKGTITYQYTASGERLAKTVNNQEVNPPVITTTLYAGGIQYTQTTNLVPALAFIPHEEGRMRPVTAGSDTFVHDYFLKDHLGNTRVVLTNEQRSSLAVATFEVPLQNTEQPQFLNYHNFVMKPDCYENEMRIEEGESVLATVSLEASHKPDRRLQLVGAAKNGKPTTLGVGKLLKVTAGDRVMANVEAWYKSDLTHEQPSDLSSHFNAILSAVQTGATQLGEATRLIGNTSMLPTAIENFITNQQNFDNERGAYLNWIFLSEETLTDEFMVTGYDDFFKGQRSPRDCDVAGAATLSMGEEGITIPQNGYLYVFVSNSNTKYPVLFDNFRVSVQHSALLEETHYYPFGLAMAGISHKASGGAVNSKKFNDGTELTTDLGIDTYETPFRGYDAQLGRFWQVDALAELDYSTSVYTFANNNPVYFNDPWGLQTNDPTHDKKDYYLGADGNIETGNLGDVTVKGTRKKEPPPLKLEQPGSRIKRGKEPFVKPDFYKVKPNFTPSKDKHNATIGPDWSINQNTKNSPYSTAFDGFVNAPKSDAGSTSAIIGYAGLQIEKTKILLQHTAKNTSGLANKANILKTAKAVSKFGIKLGFVGATATALESGFDGNGFTLGDGVKVGIGIVTTFTPFGWVYGVTDLGVAIITGTSITDRIGNSIDKKFNN